MSAYLRIHVSFLSGHYHGEEWPPAPMRLMQAIVAGSAHAGTLVQGVGALAWLEQQEPPTIHAPVAGTGETFTAYVPRNSDDLTLRTLYKDTSLHEALAKRRERYDAQETRRRWIQSPITYEWRIGDVAQAMQVGQLSQQLVCLGRAEDLAFASFQISETPMESRLERWRPTSGSSFMRNPLRVPITGSLDSLAYREQFRRVRIKDKAFVDPPVVCGERGYDPGSARASRPFLLYDLHGMEPGSWLGWRQNDGVTVAAMIRHAIGMHVPEPWRAYAIGHVDGGDLDDRLSWIPLPSIGNEHADGRIRRAMLLAPDGELADTLRFREIQHALAHVPLIQHGIQVGTMDQIDEISGAIFAYLKPSKRWCTITPLVTHGKTTRGAKQSGKFDRRKAEKLILHALAKAGLPEPLDMHFQVAPYARSGRAAREYRVPRHLSGLSRFHVSVTFPEPISGPVLAGVGQHYGLGLFHAS